MDDWLEGSFHHRCLWRTSHLSSLSQHSKLLSPLSLFRTRGNSTKQSSDLRKRTDETMPKKEPKKNAKNSLARALEPSHQQQKKKLASKLFYLRREVRRGPCPGIAATGDVQRPVRLLLLVRRGLRRVVSRGCGRSRGMVVTSSTAATSARPVADERRPEPVSPTSPSTAGEPAVAPSWPRGPAQGREAVGEGLEAVAEVGLRGHGFSGFCF